MYSTSAATAFT